MIRPRSCLALVATLLAVPSVALAHLVNSGLGPFYDGVLHLLLSPADVLGLVAVTLLAGLRGARAGRWAVMVLPPVWFAAGLLGLYAGAGVELPWASVVALMGLGVLVAADARLPAAAVATLAGLFGTIHGLTNGSALAALGAGPIALLGIAGMAMVLVLLLSAAVVSLRAAWMRVAVRVAGSWVAAVGLLMLGWLAQGTA